MPACSTYFNPRSSCEERQSGISIQAAAANDFNPRSSCEERRHDGWSWRILGGYFNPRSSCEERPGCTRFPWRCKSISIHAPHARSDLQKMGAVSVTKSFQSTLLMRGATGYIRILPVPFRFQSTLLMRGATVILPSLRNDCRISIHAPHARSDVTYKSGYAEIPISIHAPHARSDTNYQTCLSQLDIFQSTLLMRGATHNRLRACHDARNFNPRSSCEERPSCMA